MGKLRKVLSAVLAVAGAFMLIASFAQLPAWFAIWHGWFKALPPDISPKAGWITAGLLCIAFTLILWVPELRNRQRRGPSEVNPTLKPVEQPIEGTEEKLLELEIIPQTNNDSDAYLEVTSKEEPLKLSAQLRITGKYPDNGFKGYGFEGQFKTALSFHDLRDEVQRRSIESVSLKPWDSKLLRIGFIDSFIGAEETVMLLSGISGEYLIWKAEPLTTDNLPFFTVRVMLKAEGYKQPVQKDYRVGPKTPRGPLQIVEISI